MIVPASRLKDLTARAALTTVVELAGYVASAAQRLACAAARLEVTAGQARHRRLPPRDCLVTQEMPDGERAAARGH